MNIKNKLKSVIPGIILFTVVQTARAQDMGSHELPVPKSITLGEKLSDSYSKQLIHTARLFYAFWNTGDPQFARAFAMAKPIPAVDPVTRAILFFILSSISIVINSNY